MQYMLLIYSDESQEQSMSEADKQAFFGEYMEFTEAVKKAGVFVAGDALQPIATATSVRVREGKPSHTDGPFAETKEQLGGYYLLDCKDLDEALQWAAKIPSARYGSIEVRPLMIWD